MPISDKLATVEHVAAELRASEQQLDEIRARFRAALIDAHRAGASYGQLGRIVGLSRQRIARIVDDG